MSFYMGGCHRIRILPTEFKMKSKAMRSFVLCVVRCDRYSVFLDYTVRGGKALLEHELLLLVRISIQVNLFSVCVFCQFPIVTEISESKFGKSNPTLDKLCPRHIIILGRSRHQRRIFSHVFFNSRKAKTKSKCPIFSHTFQAHVEPQATY